MGSDESDQDLGEVVIPVPGEVSDRLVGVGDELVDALPLHALVEDDGTAQHPDGQHHVTHHHEQEGVEEDLVDRVVYLLGQPTHLEQHVLVYLVGEQQLDAGGQVQDRDAHRVEQTHEDDGQDLRVSHVDHERGTRVELVVGLLAGLFGLLRLLGAPSVQELSQLLDERCHHHSQGDGEHVDQHGITDGGAYELVPLCTHLGIRAPQLVQDTSHYHWVVPL